VRKFQFRRRVKNKILTVVLVVAIILPGLRALACYSLATNAYAVEVVLYRSRYDNRLVVVISEQGLRYASVEIPANEPVTGFVVKCLDVNPKQISDNVEKARGELGLLIRGRGDK